MLHSRSNLHLLTPVLALFAVSVLADSDLADLIQTERRVAAFELIDEGFDVNATQADGTSPLHWATYRLDHALVDRLIEVGATADVTNDYGATPLTEAIKAVDTPLVRTLLAAGANPDSPNLDGQTALMLATEFGALDIARLLVEHGADVNARERWREQTALMWAVDGRHAELARYLVENGADITVRAAAHDWGSQITSEPRAQYRPTGGLTALLAAARSGCTECAADLLAAGADIDRPTPDGVTPLMLAIDNMNFETAALLLDEGANPHYADWWGRTALYIAVDMNSDMAGAPRDGTSSMDIVERLLSMDVEVNPQLNMHRVGRGSNSARFTDNLLTTGATPLLRAAIMHDHEAMTALLASGALVDLPNVMGVTPLMAAASMGVRDTDFGTNRSPTFATEYDLEDDVIESLRILLAAGADINARVTDTTSLSARIARPSTMTDREGQTALFAAAGRGWELKDDEDQTFWRGWVKAVSFMLEQGADPSMTDALGRKAVDAALGRFADGDPVYDDVVALLN